MIFRWIEAAIGLQPEDLFFNGFIVSLDKPNSVNYNNGVMKRRY